MKAFLKGRRKGLTLIETVVTLGLTATVAAFVVPAVMQRSGDADPVKVSSDVVAIRSAIETFNGDVKGTFPGDIEDLANKITTSDAQALVSSSSTTFTSDETNYWKGPYLNVSSATDASTTFPTGYKGVIANAFTRYDITNNALSGDASYNTGSVPEIWLAVKITGLTSAQFEQVNDLIDGTSETDGSAAGQSQKVGKFRFDAGIAYFMAAPI